MHEIPYHSLFDIIYFSCRCYRKSLKKLLVILMWLYLCLLPLFEATTLAVDVAIAFAGSSCTLGFQSDKNFSLQCVMKSMSLGLHLSINAWNNVLLLRCEL